jgi:hypothetical protein
LTKQGAGEDALRLQRLWAQHRAQPFPASDTHDPRLQEIALFGSWLGGIVEATLAAGGKIGAGHRRLLEIRAEEGDQALWTAAAELGEPVRSYLARLIAMEQLLAALETEEQAR